MRAEELDIVIIDVDRVHRSQVRSKNSFTCEQLRGCATFRRAAFVDLGLLLGEVNVKRHASSSGVGGDRAHRWRIHGSDAVDRRGYAYACNVPQIVHALHPPLDVAVGKALLATFERPAVETTAQVAGIDQGEANP